MGKKESGFGLCYVLSTNMFTRIFNKYQYWGDNQDSRGMTMENWKKFFFNSLCFTRSSVDLSKEFRHRFAKGLCKVVDFHLVGGFNPSEKYARQKWDHLPQIWMKTKNI